MRAVCPELEKSVLIQNIQDLYQQSDTAKAQEIGLLQDAKVIDMPMRALLLPKPPLKPVPIKKK